MNRFSMVMVPLTLLAASPALGQTRGDDAAERDGLSIGGTLRVRYETIDGQARPGLNPDEDVVALRTLVQVEYRAGDWRIGGEVQDARVYGSEPATSITANEVNALELVQAYVGRRFAIGDAARIDATAGRFTLALGSRRLIAADEYRNTTRAVTGLRADLELPGVEATAFYVLPQTILPEDAQGVRDNRIVVDREDFDTQFFGGIVAVSDAIGRATIEASAYGFSERDAPGRATRDRRLGTAGARVLAAPMAGRIDYEVEGIYQWGGTRVSLAADAADQRVSAGFVHADIGYLLPGAARARLSIEYDWASGDAAGGGNGRFDTLFGMRRADLAPSGLYAQIGRTNISTPAIRVEVAPSKRFDAFAAVRAMWLAEATDSFSTSGVRDISGASGGYAGEQAEARVRFALFGPLRGEVNAVALHKGRFLREAPNAPEGTWVRYLSVAATAAF